MSEGRHNAHERPSTRKRARKRTTFACARCHRKKTRCDNLKPACSNCRLANSECLGILDGKTKTVVPRSIIQYLRDSIAQKELQLQNSHIVADSTALQPGEPLLRGQQENSPHRMSTTWVLENFNRQLSSPFLNTATGFPTDLFVFSPSHLPPVGVTIGTDPTGYGVSEERTELSEVPHKIAELLVKNYIQNILPLYPFLDAQRLWVSFEKTYPLDGAESSPEPSDIFVTSTMLCISIMTSRFSDSSRVASSSEKIFRNALCHTQHLSNSSMAALQGILLLAQYSYLMPRSASIWETVSLSMRMAVEFGLYRDPDEMLHESSMSMEEANLRRCIFWCIYEMDRSICATTHRRLSISEDVITTKYPSGKESSCFLCVVRFRRIQSEIVTVNFHCSESPCGTVNHAYEAWLEHMEQKIFDWRESIASNRSSGPEWYRVAVYHGIVFLHRPSPRNPSPSCGSLIKCFAAAYEVVSGYWENANSGFLKYSWHAIHQSFESAIVMLYALRKCKSMLRERYGIRKILETVHMYSSLFILLCERWPKATSCYETYERLKTVVLREVMRSESEPDHDMGDELDQLVLPSEVSAKHSIESNTNPVASHYTENDIISQTRDIGQQLSGQRGLYSSTMLDHDLLLRDPAFPPAMPEVLGGNLLDSDTDLMPSFDWSDFEFDVFNEHSFMLWNL